MSGKYNQELLNALTEAFAEIGEVHIIDLAKALGETEVGLSSNGNSSSSSSVGNNSQDETDYLLRSKENEKRLMESIAQMGGGSFSGCTPKDAPVPSSTTKSTFAAYSYDKTTPVPLPASILTEAQAVQHMEKQGYKHFEVYRKLGTYKAETKTEMVRQ